MIDGHMSFYVGVPRVDCTTFGDMVGSFRRRYESISPKHDAMIDNIVRHEVKQKIGGVYKLTCPDGTVLVFKAQEVQTEQGICGDDKSVSIYCVLVEVPEKG